MINAHCLGTCRWHRHPADHFALADPATWRNPIGIACDWRVVLHELGGHGILYPHVHSPNFGFSHSAGDSFAAILNDPGTAAPTASSPSRGSTSAGATTGRWAAGRGAALNDVGGYSTEQILCDDAFPLLPLDRRRLARPQARSEFAARFMSYLILRAVGSLTPATNPPNVSGCVDGAARRPTLGDWTTRGPRRRRLRQGDPLGLREAGPLPARGRADAGHHGGRAAAGRRLHRRRPPRRIPVPAGPLELPGDLEPPPPRRPDDAPGAGRRA